MARNRTNPRKQITATWKATEDIRRWEEGAKTLGYDEPSKCVRTLAEEALALRLDRLRQAAAPSVRDSVPAGTTG